MEHSKTSHQKKIHSNTGLTQEIRKFSNKQSNFTHKETTERTTNKAKSEQKKVSNKEHSRNKQNQVQKIQQINEINSWFFEKINKIEDKYHMTSPISGT